MIKHMPILLDLLDSVNMESNMSLTHTLSLLQTKFLCVKILGLKLVIIRLIINLLFHQEGGGGFYIILKKHIIRLGDLYACYNRYTLILDMINLIAYFN